MDRCNLKLNELRIRIINKTIRFFRQKFSHWYGIQD